MFNLKEELTQEGVLDMFKSKNILTTVRTLVLLSYMEDNDDKKDFIFNVGGIYDGDIKAKTTDVQKSIEHFKKFLSGDKKEIIISNKYENKNLGITKDSVTEVRYILKHSKDIEKSLKTYFSLGKLWRIYNHYDEYDITEETSKKIGELGDLIEKTIETISKENSFTDKDVTVESAMSTDSLNVIDTLVNESALQDLDTLFKDVKKYSNDFDNVSKHQTILLEEMTNESGLVSYLQNNGYEEVTSESAIEIAKKAWDKVKQVLLWLLDKIKNLFRLIKKKLFTNIDNNEKVIMSILEKVKLIKDTAKVKIDNFDNLVKPKFAFISKFEAEELGNIYTDLMYTGTILLKPIKELEQHFKVSNKSKFKTKYISKHASKDNLIVPIVMVDNIVKIIFAKKNNYNLDTLSIEETIIPMSNLSKEDIKILSKKDIIDLLQYSLNFNEFLFDFTKKIEKNLNDYKVVINNIEKNLQFQDFKEENRKNLTDTLILKSSESIHTTLLNGSMVFIESLSPTIKNMLSILVENIKCFENKE